jgi:glyoxylase I family protein
MMRAIDHVGVTVTDLDRALEFWCGRLGLRLLHRATETDRDLAALIGEETVEIEIADLDGGDGQIIELIKYHHPTGRPIRARSCDPGAALGRLEGSAARQISRHPVVLRDPGGRWDGAVCCYLTDPDGIIIELIQRPRNAE